MNKLAEEIGILEEMIENENIENMDMNDCFGGEHIEAIEHVLSDYKRVLKENEELKNLIAHKNAYTKMLEKDLFENCSNYVISKQKVKDKIEEYKNILKTCNETKDVDRIKAINERVLELEELLDSNDTNVGSI